MNADLAQELLNVLGSSLENLETQHAALLQLLKDNGVVSDDQLAPYLTQAGKTSNVRWRAAHIRLDRLFDSEKQIEQQVAEKEHHKADPTQAFPQNQESEAKSKKDDDSGGAAPPQAAVDANAAKDSAPTQSTSAINSQQNQQVVSEDNKASPNQEKKGS
jgi:hypothetical protein